MGDRGGGREPKGGSLKLSKKNPGAPAGKAKKTAASGPVGPSVSAPPPIPGEGTHFDCSVALLSRQFDRDRDRVLQRSRTEGSVCAMVVWSSDFEKQDPLANLCAERQGLCYSVIGVHPDNVDRTNKAKHESWMARTEELARRAECVGILSGLNLGREMATHYAQKSLLQLSIATADRLKLPLLLHIAGAGGSLEETLEILSEHGQSPERTVVVHDVVTACGGDVLRVAAAAAAGLFCSVSAAGITDGAVAARSKARACVAAVPIGQMLVCSDSPWRTPQNLADEYLRTLRNEPANFPSVVAAVAEALGEPDVDTFSAQLRNTALRVFGLTRLLEVDVSTASDRQHAPAWVIDVPATQAPDARNTEEENTRAVEVEAVDGTSSMQASLESLSVDGNIPYYSCHKCCTALFLPSEILAHGDNASAARTFFTTNGDEKFCSAVMFLRDDGDSRRAFSVEGGSVECIKCKAKLGRYSSGNASCTCGATVPGPSLRITATKVDLIDGTASLNKLVDRARFEAEEPHQQNGEQLVERKKNKKRAKGKVQSLNNRGNFSNFRNKDFVPNSSRAQKRGVLPTVDDATTTSASERE